MNETDYKKLKKQVEDKYQETVLLAEEQRKSGLEAIERVWDMLKETQRIPIVEIPDRGRTKTKISYGSFTATIKKAVKLVPAKKFTKNDIRLVLPQVSKEIADTCKDASLAGCLMRLEKQGIIEKIKGGKGSSPSLYKVVQME